MEMTGLKVDKNRLAEKYKQLNDSFDQKLIFHLGAEAGFFSEYNNMILAMLYCLKHRIRFTLFSADANFKYEKGWTDFFLPFCEEEQNHYHALHHRRRPLQLAKNAGNSIVSFVHNQIINPARLQKNKLQDRLTRLRYFPEARSSYFTYELWDRFHSGYMQNTDFNIPELGIIGDVRDGSRVLIELTWRYQPEVEKEIKKNINTIELPAEYIGLHIRGGDKIIERELEEIETYIVKAESLSSCRTAFVLTDDYRVIIELQKNYSQWNFFTLCEKTSLGYYHNAFNKEDNAFKRDQHIKLFASLDLLSKAALFIGTYSSNIGMFLGMRMDRTKCFGVDFDDWRIS